MSHTLKNLQKLYALPFADLVFKAQETHREHHNSKIQLCVLKSIKTGRCPEDCAYCPQSAHHNTSIEPEALLDTEAVLKDAKQAKAQGAERFCMGAAWKSPPKNASFKKVLETVGAVKALELEVCCTLGMLDAEQAQELKQAGCDVYNHNLDTSRDYYDKIITTRSYDDRLKTLENVRSSGMQVCCGGILGMGESVDDRLKMLVELAALSPQPESVPINALIPISGTPLENQAPIDSFELARIIAVTRIAIPKTMVRLSAGRHKMSQEAQALCFLAGANSIFLGDKLLTAPNPKKSDDFELLEKLGLERPELKIAQV